MLQVARLAKRLLGDSTELVAQFLLGQVHAHGGFKNRDQQSDLYYTVFGLDGLFALEVDLPAPAETASYLESFGTGQSLDLVHLAALVRCWSSMPQGMPGEHTRQEMLEHLEGYRSGDGGYHPTPGAAHGTVYGCFLALGAYQDLKAELPDPERLVHCVATLEAADGGYANQAGMAVGTTPATAAAVTILRQFHHAAPPSAAKWLLGRCGEDGGFFATPQAPMPDLLSTATALHALAGMDVSFEGIKQPCLDFVDQLWTSQGTFYPNYAEESLDCEYTFYGLLALGHLSL